MLSLIITQTLADRGIRTRYRLASEARTTGKAVVVHEVILM